MELLELSQVLSEVMVWVVPAEEVMTVEASTGIAWISASLKRLTYRYQRFS
jgi:hypothetical protein